jgi:hypothetical protein
MKEDEKQEGVYGENHPASEDQGGSGRNIREEIAKKDPNKEGVASEMDEARERSDGQTGGMGRVETPKDGTSQGGWQRPEEPVSDRG